MLVSDKVIRKQYMNYNYNITINIRTFNIHSWWISSQVYNAFSSPGFPISTGLATQVCMAKIVKDSLRVGLLTAPPVMLDRLDSFFPETYTAFRT